MSYVPSKKSKGFDQPDAKGYMPTKEEENNANEAAQAAKIVLSHCDTDAESEDLEIPQGDENSVLETKESQGAKPDIKESPDAETETKESECVEPETKESEDTEHQTNMSQDAEPVTIESQDDEPVTKESHDAELDTKKSRVAEPETKESQGAEPQTKVSQSDEPQTKVSQDNELETKENQHCDNGAELETIHIPHSEDCVVVFGSMAGKKTHILFISCFIEIFTFVS